MGGWEKFSRSIRALLIDVLADARSMHLRIVTPKTERGTPARGTLVATDQSTPAQSGAYGTSDQLIGTDARKAKQAQRREAREAKQRTLLASTPLPASSKSAARPADAAEATPPED